MLAIHQKALTPHRRTVALLIFCGLLSTACAANKKSPKDPGKPNPPPVVPLATNTPIDPAMRGQARVVIEESLRNNDPIIEANAVEAIQNTTGAESADLILKALGSKNSLVRFSAAMTAGTLKLEQARSILEDLLSDPSPSVRLGSRYALHKLGDFRNSHDFEKTAGDASSRVRAETAIVLGLIGDASGLKILRTMTSDHDAAVRFQVAEAMWRLGSEDALDVLVAGTISGHPDDQIICLLALAGPKDQRVMEHVRGKLTAEWPEVSLAAARAMGIFGSAEGFTVAVEGAKSKDPRQQALAALALGAIGRPDAQPSLQKLLTSENPNVKLAAATAILQLKSGEPSVSAGR